MQSSVSIEIVLEVELLGLHGQRSQLLSLAAAGVRIQVKHP